MESPETDLSTASTPELIKELCSRCHHVVIFMAMKGKKRGDKGRFQPVVGGDVLACLGMVDMGKDHLKALLRGDVRMMDIPRELEE